MQACLTSPYVPPSRTSQGRRTPGRSFLPTWPVAVPCSKHAKKRPVLLALCASDPLFFLFSSFRALDKSRPIGFQTTTSHHGSEGCAPAGVTTKDEWQSNLANKSNTWLSDWSLDSGYIIYTRSRFELRLIWQFQRRLIYFILFFCSGVIAQFIKVCHSHPKWMY